MPTLPKGFVFLLLLAVSLGIWGQPLARTIKMAWGAEAYTHILLILPVSGALIYLERRSLPMVSKPALSAGMALLALALSLGALARFGTSDWPDDVRLSLSVLALVTWWIGGVVACFGLRTFQAFLFPLCFLFWLVPVPTFALDQIISLLQQHSALAARVLFVTAGVPVTQDGTMLSIPGLDIEVAPQCSSIRSSSMLMITTMLLGHLFLRSWWRKGLLIAVAVPLAAIKNGLRIFTIAELGTRVDPGFFDGNLHHHGGIVFLAISVAMTLGLLWILRRTENATPPKLEIAP